MSVARYGDASGEPLHRAHEHRHNAERHHGKEPIEPQHNHRHADQQHQRRQDRKDAVHGQRLDGEGVGREAVEEIPHFASAVEGHREALEMGVQLRTEIVHQPLAQVNGDVAAGDTPRAEERMDQHQHQTATKEQRLRGKTL